MEFRQFLLHGKQLMENTYCLLICGQVRIGADMLLQISKAPVR